MKDGGRWRELNMGGGGASCRGRDEKVRGWGGMMWNGGYGGKCGRLLEAVGTVERNRS